MQCKLCVFFFLWKCPTERLGREEKHSHKEPKPNQGVVPTWRDSVWMCRGPTRRGGKTQTHTHTHEVEHFYATENRHRSGLCSRSNLHGKYPDKSEDHTQQGDSVAHLSHVRTNSSRAAQLKIRKTSADTCGMKTKRQSTRPSWADFFGFWRAIHVIGRLCFLPSSAVGRSTESNDWARVFFDDREPQHNRGADDKHSLSEDVGMFFLFCFVLF